MCSWAVWHDRMKILHSDNKIFNGSGVSWCFSLLQDYKDAVKLIKQGDGSRKSESENRWTRPPENRLKMNVDVAVNWETNSLAIGGVVRDNEGRMVLAFGKIILRPPSVTFAELVAIKEGLQMALHHMIETHEINSDSFQAVQAVTNPEVDLSYVGAIANVFVA